MKLTNNKPSQSTPIRKGKVSDEEIKKIAEELTRLQVVEAPKIETDDYNKNPPVVKGFKPSYCTGVKEPLATPGNYKVFAETLKAVIDETGQFEVTGDQLKLFFPQRHYGGQVAMHLKRYYGLSYRRVENGRNDTYVFFVEPTREELIIMLTSAESKAIEWEQTARSLSNKCTDWYESWINLNNENTQLKSDLSNSQKTNKILFAFAIGAVITILIKSVAL